MVRDWCSGCDELYIAGRTDLKGVEEVGITYKEYVWLVKPDDVDDIFYGRVRKCPCEYGISYEESSNCDRNMTCDDCMNQEIPYPVIAEVIRDTYLNPFEKITVGAKYKVTDVDMGAPTFGVMICVSGYNHWANNNNFRYYINKEGKKVQKEFTKSDLKDGMMCERADGKKMLWFNGEMRGIDAWCSGTQSNLTNPGREDLSIVRVGYPDFDKHTTISSALKGEFKEILWERKQEKEISSEEAFAVLKEHYGCDVKIKE